jgi:hypothetical protein
VPYLSTVQAHRADDAVGGAEARRCAEEAETMKLIIGADDAFGPHRPRRHLPPRTPAMGALARHVQGLLPLIVFFVVDGVVRVVKVVKGDAFLFLLPEDLRSYHPARP